MRILRNDEPETLEVGNLCFLRYEQQRYIVVKITNIREETTDNGQDNISTQYLCQVSTEFDYDDSLVFEPLEFSGNYLIPIIAPVKKIDTAKKYTLLDVLEILGAIRDFSYCQLYWDFGGEP